MTTKLEEMLTRELHGVADSLHVPPVPQLPAPTQTRRPDPARVWRPLLAAAAVVLVAGVLALVLARHDGGSPQPAPAPGLDQVSRSAPTVPYVLAQRLYVDGAQVPGTWAPGTVESRRGQWIAMQVDGTWWSGGPGRDTGRIDARLDQPPVISPKGRYVAFVDTSGGTASLTGFDTDPAGEGFGAAPIDPRTEDGVPLGVRAVTDDGDVIVQLAGTSLMWRAQTGDGQEVVNLGETAPDQVVLQATAAGLVVVDGSSGASDATSTEPYLADVSPDGRLTRRATLPTYDDLDVSPGGAWLVRSPAGTLGGEVGSVPSLEAQPVGHGDGVALDAPRGWGFAVGTWQWEDDRSFVSVLLPADGAEGATRLARCDVALDACRLLSAPGGGGASPKTETPAGTVTGMRSSYTPEQALTEVVRAAAAGDRAALGDPAVIADGEWEQLHGYAANSRTSVKPCRDNGGGTWDCEIAIDAHPSTTYYAIVEPAQNGYGWRVSYVGVGGA